MPQGEKHAAIYVRVSSAGQKHASQEPELKRWVEKADEPVTCFRDTFTGRTMDRPGFEKLMEAVRAGGVSKVVIWRLDRLGRTAKGLTQLFAELRQRKIDLVSLRDGFTLSTAAGRLTANILASMAEFETEVRAERVRASQAAAKAKGKTWGGSRNGWRYRSTQAKIPVILDLLAKGAPKAHIARAVGISRKTVYSILARHEGNRNGQGG
ncbi:MAG: recombinase family protein [Candidatus Tectomicrobia bacterium]|nr:recombinase family protein [Candidatus Tectomicrobia bacterium]